MSKKEPPTPEEVLRGQTVIYLATSDGDQPRVRPVTLVEADGEFFVLTGSKDKKVAQIMQNNKVELVVPVQHEGSTGHIRFSAEALIEKDPKYRAKLAKTATFFNLFWDSPEHPNYTLLRIKPVTIEYMKPHEYDITPITKLDFRNK